MQGIYDLAAIAIFVAMIMDGLDGRVARLTNTQSAFGAEFDSLADMTSFGIAPALVVFSWALGDLGKLGWLAAFIYTAAGALRLARFNTQIGQMDKRYFQGVPTPAAAGFIASLVWLASEYDLPVHENAPYIALLTVLIGLLMVSNIRYHSFKQVNVRGRVPFAAILVVVLIIVSISLDPPVVLAFIFFSYALSGPILTLWSLRRARAQRRASSNSLIKLDASRRR